MRWVALVAAVVLLGILVAACSGSYGPLVADQRVKIVEPKPGATVREPVTLRWTSTFDPGTPSGRWFMVYVDVAPVPPGQSALSAARTPCASVPECIAAGAINGPNYFLTDKLSVDPGPIPTGAGPEHRFTIVLVDEHGVRQGAVGWNASFRIETS